MTADNVAGGLCVRHETAIPIRDIIQLLWTAIDELSMCPPLVAQRRLHGSDVGAIVLAGRQLVSLQQRGRLVADDEA